MMDVEVRKFVETFGRPAEKACGDAEEPPWMPRRTPYPENPTATLLIAFVDAQALRIAFRGHDSPATRWWVLGEYVEMGRAIHELQARHGMNEITLWERAAFRGLPAEYRAAKFFYFCHQRSPVWRTLVKDRLFEPPSVDEMISAGSAGGAFAGLDLLESQWSRRSTPENGDNA